MSTDEEGRRKIAACYRVTEPICNFKVRVKVVQQRSLLAEILENERETRDSSFLIEEDRIFSWQEKVFSLFEVNFYSDGKNCVTENQQKCHKRIVDESLEGSQLYSYINSDSYYPGDSLLTKPYKSPLSQKNELALPSIRNRKPFVERYNKAVLDVPVSTRIRSNHYLYMERYAMYILADLTRKDDEIQAADVDSETLLCTITYDKANNILKVDPDFTCGDFYTVVNKCGIKFDYMIEHASEKQPASESQRHLNHHRHQRGELIRETQDYFVQKEPDVFQDIQLMSQNTLRVFLSFEIVSAHGFFYDGVFVTYCFDMPHHWSTSQKERLYGRTQKSRIRNDSAVFGHVIDICLDFCLDEVADINMLSPLCPRLLLSVASLDSWTRYRTEGYGAVPLPILPGTYKFTVPTWRATGSIIDSLRRFFTGGTYELEDITYCSIPSNHEGPVLNKSNLNVTSSGTVKINVNIVCQDRMNAKGIDWQNDSISKINTDTLMDNVESVLEQFKAAKERMIQIKAMQF